MTWLVSPTERPPFPSLGRVSSVPEQLGVDFLTFSPAFGPVGVQRKEVNDLVGSLSDGRVAKEVMQMRGLGVGVWLIEGRPQWSGEGQLLSSRTAFSIESFQGVMFSLQSQGFWLMRTDSQQESMSSLSALGKWVAKPKHHGLNGRPGAKSILGGPANDADWQVHFLQGLPGVGYDRARAIVKHFGGSPVGLKDGVDLTEVKGVGKVIAERIGKVLG